MSIKSPGPKEKTEEIDETAFNELAITVPATTVD